VTSFFFHIEISFPEKIAGLSLAWITTGKIPEE
jgi:hypothetical protein